MNDNIELPKPILLNCLKHHACYIKSKIDSLVFKVDELQNHLRNIGDSQMDLYMGELTPGEICSLVIDQLKQKQLLERSKYIKWLAGDGSDYQTMTLPDSSVWTLRLAEDSKRYVHIHPGRYSPHTVRVKALQLKTAIAVLMHAKLTGNNPFEIKTINLVRREVMNESPIKSLEKSEGLMNVIRILSGDKYENSNND